MRRSPKDHFARARRALRAAGVAAAQHLELRDGIFGLGFAIAWYGGYHISKPWSFVAAGVFMMLVALLVMKSSTEGE